MRRIDRKESLSGTTRLAGGFLDTMKQGFRNRKPCSVLYVGINYLIIVSLRVVVV